MPGHDDHMSVHGAGAADGDRSRGESSLAERVIDACLALGFARAGIAPALPTSRRAEYLDWLATGQHGDMDFMQELLEERLDITRMLPGAKSVIMVADRYAAGASATDRQPAAEGRGRVARYARGQDYHRVIKTRLHQLAGRLRALHSGHEFRSFVDSGPVMEREHAERAMGSVGAFIGKHTLLIDPDHGSFLLLGGMVTTLDIPRQTPVRPKIRTDHCGTCTRCIDACPTAAITPYKVDARKCISYLTLEHHGTVEPHLHRGMQNWILGCDICQDVCPFNTPGKRAGSNGTDRVNTAYLNESRASLDLREVLKWTEADRRRELAGSAAKRATLDMIRRSAIIAAGNAGMMNEVRAIAADEAESPLIRTTAIDVLSNLTT